MGSRRLGPRLPSGAGPESAHGLGWRRERAEHGFKEGDKVWVEDGNGKHHPGVFVGDNESSGWFGGGPSAYVVHPEAHNAEVVSIFRITPRDE